MDPIIEVLKSFRTPKFIVEFGSNKNRLATGSDPNQDKFEEDDFLYHYRVKLDNFESPIELDLYLTTELDNIIDSFIFDSYDINQITRLIRSIINSYRLVCEIDEGGIYSFKENEKYYSIDKKYQNLKEQINKVNIDPNDPVDALNKPVDSILNWEKNLYSYIIVSHLTDFINITSKVQTNTYADTQFGFKLREDKFSVLRDVYLELIKNKVIGSNYKYLTFKRIFNEQFTAARIDWKLSQKALKYFINQCIDNKIINKPSRRYEIIERCFTHNGSDLNSKSLESAKKPVIREKTIIDSVVDLFTDLTR